MGKNMELWDAVSSTDPKHTKKVNQRGGFTAIDATYQLEIATQLWGSYGATWGLRNLSWSFLECENQKPSMILDAEFYYPDGAFEISVDWPYRAGDDTRKKLLTSARSKALAMLGWNADIFLGKFEDNQYVHSQANQYEAEDDLRSRAIAKIRAAADADEMDGMLLHVNKLFRNGAISKPLQSELLEIAERVAANFTDEQPTECLEITDEEKQAILDQESQTELPY